MRFITELLAVFTSNLVLTRGLGTSTMYAAAKNRDALWGLGLTVSLFCCLGSAVTWCLNRLLLPRFALAQPLVYMLALSLLYVAALLVLARIGSPQAVRLRRYVHLSVFNCAVLGTLFLNAEAERSFAAAMLFSLKAGAGFFLASCLVGMSARRLNSALVPASFRGYPAMLIYVGVLAMACAALQM